MICQRSATFITASHRPFHMACAILIENVFPVMGQLKIVVLMIGASGKSTRYINLGVD
jgi:hypothetical protein